MHYAGLFSELNEPVDLLICQAELFLQAILSFHNADIMHGDLAGRNVFILNYDELLADNEFSKSPQIVFIDWSRAVRISEARNSPRSSRGKSFWHEVLWQHVLDLSKLKGGGFLGQALTWIEGPGLALWEHCYNVSTHKVATRADHDSEPA
jgi:hypothetical protein